MNSIVNNFLNSFIVLSAVLSLAFIPRSANAAELVSLKDYLKKELAGAAKMSKENFSVSADKKKELSKIAPDAQDEQFTFYYAKKADGALDKACTVVAQQGKEGPMSIGVCFDNVGLVQSVTILSSEEEHGKKVAEESWLKQFKGKKVSDAFQVGRDVDGVSGATMSSKAVAETLRKSSFAFSNFVGNKK